ncbi:MAG: gliding motility-associated-like protein [Saprospiraceae bacterium]
MGFASYLWADNSTESTYLALTDGIHFVEVSDSCGRIQRDTLIITTEISMQAQIISNNQIVCPGDEVLLSTTLMYDTLNWYIDDQVICENCDSLLVTPIEEFTIHVIANSTGCISTDSILLTILPTYLDTIYEKICFGDSIVINGESYLDSGVYSIDSQTLAGCDSIIVLLLTENPEDIVIQNIQTCAGDSVFVSGQYYYDNSFLLSSDQNIYGCDSVTDISIILVEELSDTTFISICENDSTLIFDIWEKEAGTFSMGFPTSGGCDSTHVTILTIEFVGTSNQYATICIGDSIFFNNTYYSEADLYQANLISQDGCDSIIFLDLSVDTIIEITVPLILCQLDTFTTTSDTLTNDGVAQEVFQSAFGCDSVVTYDVTFIARHFQIGNYYMCEGDSFFLKDQYYFEAVIFADTFAGVLCDSIISYDLTVFPSSTSSQSYVLTNGDPIEINNEQFNEAGDYEQIIPNSFGCDSLILISITEDKTENIVYPNIFSQNSDNINDEWIFDLTGFSQSEISIYDRLGNKVGYWQNETEVRWNGQFNVAALVQGVYVFVLKYEDRGVAKMEIGNITLIR